MRATETYITGSTTHHQCSLLGTEKWVWGRKLRYILDMYSKMKVYMYVCVRVCVCVCVCLHLLMLNIFLNYFSALLFETGFLTELRAH